MKWTEAKLKKIRALNAKLKAEEKRILTFAQTFIPSLEEMEKQGIIDGYNCFPNLRLFSSNAACNKRHKIELDDSFYESGIEWGFISYFDYGNAISELKQNYNEFRTLRGGHHPLENEVFCYTMHCIVHHARGVSWADILAIDDVWLELKIEYQWMTKK